MEERIISSTMVLEQLDIHMQYKIK
jgi:hypothetical protein